MDVRHLLATNIRRIRREKGLSQEDLAYEAGINRPYMSKLETGKTYAGLEIVEKLAKTLKVEPAELLRRPQRKSR